MFETQKNPQNQQTQAASQSRQPGQNEPQTSQRQQDDRFGSQDAGRQPTGRQGSEVAPAQGPEGGQLARQDSQQQDAITVLPPVDIFEDETGFTVMADMPGISKDQLVVRVTGDNLLIEGTASAPATGAMELVYGEMQTPQYRRSFTLSRELDPGKIEARLNNGVLKLRIPKAEQARPRRIEVNVG